MGKDGVENFWVDGNQFQVYLCKNSNNCQLNVTLSLSEILFSFVN